MIYAGIGSRQTPPPVLDRMQQWGAYFARYGFTLRSGRARGADSAFEIGYRFTNLSLAEIFTADDARYKYSYVAGLWMEHAARYHPAWERCSDYAKLLHARNSAIMLGAALNEPVDFVMCWTIDGKASGGTGQALRIAAAPEYNIPVFNMYDATCEERLREWLGKAMR